MGFFDVLGGVASGGMSLIPGQISSGLGNLPGGMIGDMLTGGAISNAKSVAETNQMQMHLADKQMAFQERMSNTAYERAMADMKRAGLNPMLAFDKGGASTPSGAMATLTAPRKGDIGAGLLNTAKTIASEGASFQNVKSQTDLNKANAQVADVSAEKITANAKESEANTQYTKQLQRKAEADTRAARANARLRELDVPGAEARKGIDAKLAPIDAVMERLNQALGLLGNGYRTFKGNGPSYEPRNNNPSDYDLHRAGRRGVRLP